LKRVVVSLLQNIDAVHGQTVLIAATNHEHLLDPAIWRRFAYRVHVGLPSIEAREWMFSTFLSRSASSKFVRKAAAASDGLSGSDIKNICDGARRESILRDADGVAEAEVLKRILLATIPDASASVDEIIRAAKASYPQVYTLRVLAEAFKMSHSNVAYQLKRAPSKSMRANKPIRGSK
jgi:SpoVK/Ycf46/Vps4 family AAA+-type ATPase